ncbi:MAG: methyltransferase domain-containing protein [Woeseiaceae bacterium]|nr:methyltransferase domain-containing protein [Woeseiaceae bacterium]
MSVSGKDHWEHVYTTKGPTEVSWYQPVPAKSMSMIRETKVPLEAPIIDIGGGTSTLVDLLLNSDYSDITVLDISSAALDESHKRIGDRASEVHWIESDILEFEPLRRYYVWHDRATFHFQVNAAAIEKYLDIMRTALVPKGFFALCTYGPQGPDRCSNLPVQSYSVEELTFMLESGFELLTYELEDHKTPTGALQQFLYTLWRAKDSW